MAADKSASRANGGAEDAKQAVPEPSKKRPKNSGLKEARQKIGKATGTKKKSLQDRLLNQALAGVWLRDGHSQDNAILATLAALEAIAPSDAVEGMLATQMVATHEAAMECLRRAMIAEQTFEGRDANLKHAEKLMQIYARQIEVLDKRRGGGRQKITVEHVTVEAGGQAIMGDVHLDKKKPATEAPTMLEDLSVAPLDSALLAPARTREKQPVKRGER